MRSISVDRTDTPLAARFRALGGACGLAVLVLGVLVLLGWAFDVALLKSVLPGLVSMKANTAAGFLFGGAALLLSRERADTGRRRAAQACAAAMALLGALTLAEHVVGWDLRIDQVLFRSAPSAADTAAPGRMAPETASSFLLLGVALLLLDTETRGGHRPAQALALLAGLAAVLALLGYLYGVAGSMRMALHTAAAFLLLATGVIAVRPEGGGMALLTGDSVGGVMLRRLAAPVVLLPVALGWLRLEGERAGLFGLGAGLALFAFANIVILSALLHVGAQAIKSVEVRRRNADALFRTLVESAPDAVALVDRSGVIHLVNAQAERMFGYERGALLGQPIELLIPERFQRAHTEHRRGYAAAPRPRAMGSGLDLHGRRHDGTEFAVEISLSPVDTEEGLHVASIIRDVSERKEAESALARTAQDLARSNRELEDLTSNMRAAKQRLRALSHRLLELQEAERRHLARELHDQLGGSITAIKLNLEAALHFPDRPGLDEHLREAVSLLERLLSDVRSLSLQLRPALLDELGLDAAIRSLVEQQAGRAGLTFRFEALRPPGRLDNDLEAACFRVAQEAVSNALRHSQAKSLQVALWIEGEQLHLVVSDDGTGFDLDEVHRRVDSSPGFGLVSMQERALLAGGQLTIRTRPGAGTEVHAVFPTSPAGPRKRSGEVPRQ